MASCMPCTTEIVDSVVNHPSVAGFTATRRSR